MLTERESEVAVLVAQGLQNRAVAHHLGIGEGTVKIHLHNIYRKLGIENRSQLVRHALKARRIGANVVEFPRLLGRKG
jgi:DNA-binding NarL/FixJ family response regulator